MALFAENWLQNITDLIVHRVDDDGVAYPL
ncbi:hypothetical protein AF72_09550 [Xylella taiwanensis]|uniref:Uncharacterized protein n=1 Tax=Xylella taiwanensis TaxID=1444770 RepID=Z9JIV4_9GAMM|nr:hypothetical protein AF72_09550 [Xylella taiwanensis]